MENEDQDKSLFREATPRVEQEIEVPKRDEPPKHTIVVPDEVENKPSEYPTIKKYPYLTEVLEIDKEIYNTFDIKPQSEEIDDFLRSEVKRNNLKDDKETYKNLVEKYLKKINISEDSDIYTKVEKLSEYLKIQKKLLEGIDERDRLLNSDPMELSSSQLKKYIELKGV